MATSNIDDVVAAIRAKIESFGFRSAAPSGETAGAEINRALAANISRRGLDERRGVSGPFEANAPDYAARKERDYGHSDPNRRTGQMLSADSCEGRPEIGDKEMTMRHGKGETPSSGRPWDRRTTDTIKGQLAHDGQSASKVVRKFYEIDAADADLATGILDGAAQAHFNH